MKNEYCTDCSLRKQVSAALGDQLCTQCHLRSFKQNDLIYQNSRFHVVNYILEGVGMEFCSFDGGEKNVSLGPLKEGGFFGLSQFAGDIAPFNEQDRYFQFLQDSTCCVFSNSAIELIDADSPELHNLLVSKHSSQLVDSITHLMRLATFNSEEKIAYLLTSLKEYGVDLDTITQDNMANILNINRYTITKKLPKVLGKM